MYGNRCSKPFHMLGIILTAGAILNKQIILCWKNMFY